MLWQGKKKWGAKKKEVAPGYLLSATKGKKEKGKSSLDLSWRRGENSRVLKGVITDGNFLAAPSGKKRKIA